MSWEIAVNAGPACPIRFATPEHQNESLADQCLTAAEIEWRRWSGWQMERTAEKQFRKSGPDAQLISVLWQGAGSCLWMCSTVPRC